MSEPDKGFGRVVVLPPFSSGVWYISAGFPLLKCGVAQIARGVVSNPKPQTWERIIHSPLA